MTQPTDKNVNYFVRITADPDLVIDWTHRNAKYWENIIAYKHDENVSRPHVHIILFNTQVTYQAIKQSWKQYWFDTVDKPWVRTDWSFKTFEHTEDDVKKMMVYCSKGKYEPVEGPWLKGLDFKTYPEEHWAWTYHKYINQAIKDWETPKRNVPIQYKLVESLNPTQMKKKKNVMIHEIVEKLDETPTDQEIVDTIVEYFKFEKLIFNRYLVKEFFDTIIARIKTKSFKQEMYIFCKINNYREYE